MKQSHKTLLLWVVLIVMFLTIWQFLTPAERKQSPSRSANSSARSTRERVDEIHIKDREYTYRIKGADPTKGGGTRRPSVPYPTRS